MWWLSGVAAQVAGYIGTLVLGLGGLCILGVAVLYAVMSAKEAGNEPRKPLTEKEQRENDDLELAMREIKDSIPFTAVYGAMAVLFTLFSADIILNSDGAWYGAGGLAAGLLLSQYYIRKSVRQFKWLSRYRKRRGGGI